MLYFTSAGNSQNRPLLFLHGFMGSGEDYLPILDNFEDKYYCIAVDLPGHGKSILPMTGKNLLEEFCGHVIATLDDLKVDSFDVVGYSMGGRIALNLKRLYPERIGKTVIISSHGSDTPSKEIDHRIALLSSLPFKHFVKQWYAMPLFTGIKNRDVIEKKRSNIAQYGLKMCLDQISRKNPLPLWEYGSTYILGEYDQKYQSIFKKHNIPYHLVECASHYVIGDQPEICKSLILKELQLDVTANT